MREVYIIERNGNHISYKVKEAPEGIPFDSEPYDHASQYRKYIKDNNIQLENDKLLSFEFGEELSKLGISSIIVENKVMCIFLPEHLSDEQSKWFIDRKNILRHYNISYGYIKDNELITKDPDRDEGEMTLIKDFYKHIKKDIQIQKEGEINELGRAI